MTMEYCYDQKDGELIRYDCDKNIYEAYNWKEKRWEYDKDAYAAAYGFYDGFLHKIIEQDVEKITTES